MNSEDRIMRVENPQLVGKEQIAVYVPVGEILDSMADDPDERFKGNRGPEGPEGPEGVGISSIFTGIDNNLIIQLSNGNTYSVAIPTVKGDPGPQGDPFFVSIIYNSVQEMEDNAATDGIPNGAFALIDTGNVEDVDNAKLFVKKNSVYSYLTDMSGASGIQGPAGVSITSVIIDSNSHLKVTLSNGTTLDAGKIEVSSGTEIMVNGEAVSSWSADTKLDKITSTVNLRGDRVYAISKTGSQKTIYAEGSPNGSTIPLRDANGQLFVKDPTAYNHAASKQYVDNAVLSAGGGSVETYTTTFAGDIASYLLDPSDNHFVTIALESSTDPYPFIMTAPIYLPMNDISFMTGSLYNTIYTDRFTVMNYPDDTLPLTTPLDFGLLKLEYDTTGTINISFSANDQYFAGISTVYIIDQTV